MLAPLSVFGFISLIVLYHCASSLPLRFEFLFLYTWCPAADDRMNSFTDDHLLLFYLYILFFYFPGLDLTLVNHLHPGPVCSGMDDGRTDDRNRRRLFSDDGRHTRNVRQLTA